MNWNQITVRQFQQIYQLPQAEGLSEMEILAKSIAIIFNLKENEVDNLTHYEFMRKANACTFPDIQISAKPVNSLIAAGNKFTVSEITEEQIASMLQYEEDLIPNLHLVLAGIVQPVRSGIMRLFKKELTQEQIALQMLEALFGDAFNTLLFAFRSIEKAYLKKGVIGNHTSSPTDAFMKITGKFASIFNIQEQDKISVN